MDSVKAFIQNKNNLPIVLLGAFIFFVLPVVVLVTNRENIKGLAAGIVHTEAESGTLEGPAAVGEDANASGGQYITFNISPGAPTASPSPSLPPIAQNAVYVSTTGSDTNPGTAAAPWRTVRKGITSVQPGQTLYLRGGEYVESVGGTLQKGTATSRITMRSYPGERAVIRGNTTLSNPFYWTVTDLEFTWPESPTGSGGTAAVFFISAGESWIVENNEIHHGNYAGMLIGRASPSSTTAGAPQNSIIRHNIVHDTGAVGLYFNPGQDSRNMLIERNIFWNNGTENVKLGWGGDNLCSGTNYAWFGIGEVTMRYNTMYASGRHYNLIIAEPGSAGQGRIDVYNNIMYQAPAASVRYDNTEGCLGDRVYVQNNIGGSAPKFREDFNRSPINVSHELNNLFPVDPQFDSTVVGGFHPQNPQAIPYGRYAAE